MAEGAFDLGQIYGQVDVRVFLKFKSGLATNTAGEGELVQGKQCEHDRPSRLSNSLRGQDILCIFCSFQGLRTPPRADKCRVLEDDQLDYQGISNRKSSSMTA